MYIYNSIIYKSLSLSDLAIHLSTNVYIINILRNKIQNEIEGHFDSVCVKNLEPFISILKKVV